VSAGAIPALAFAQRFPHRCTALVPVVPVFHLPGRPPVAPWSPLQERAVRMLLGSDLVFWAAMTLAPDRVIGTILATDPALVHAAAPAEAARVRAVMRALLPISRRTGGLLFDGAQANRPLDLDLAAIRVPTLAISCADDRYRSAENARHIAATVPGARARIFPDGGHVWVGRNDELAAAIDRFLRQAGGA
jgi:pimeloyl-ACP methyl ester carboxylesterase